MSSEPTGDRLAEAKHLAGAAGTPSDSIIWWLIAEVERLRTHVEDYRRVNEASSRTFTAEVESSRVAAGILQKLSVAGGIGSVALGATYTACGFTDAEIDWLAAAVAVAVADGEPQ